MAYHDTTLPCSRVNLARKCEGQKEGNTEETLGKGSHHQQVGVFVPH